MGFRNSSISISPGLTGGSFLTLLTTTPSVVIDDLDIEAPIHSGMVGLKARRPAGNNLHRYIGRLGSEKRRSMLQLPLEVGSSRRSRSTYPELNVTLDRPPQSTARRPKTPARLRCWRIGEPST